ncbi:hypothetical protein [Sphingopyxis sp. MC1]|uniref:hypothetical protein n=1 Tax=Sphingopyxis sp. MC1 TaxID=1174684 RepID=UPI0012DEFD28|nr:hypothetical protein [Sphingopyxis sp. MC1]
MFGIERMSGMGVVSGPYVDIFEIACSAAAIAKNPANMRHPITSFGLRGFARPKLAILSMRRGMAAISKKNPTAVKSNSSDMGCGNIILSPASVARFS